MGIYNFFLYNGGTKNQILVLVHLSQLPITKAILVVNGYT